MSGDGFLFPVLNMNCIVSCTNTTLRKLLNTRNLSGSYPGKPCTTPPRCTKPRQRTIFIFPNSFRWRLEAHKATHIEERPFLCSHCGKRFKNDKNLKHHLATSHTIKLDPSNTVAKFVCVVCERSFSEERGLKTHIEIVHEKKRPHLCSACGHAGIVATCQSFFF